VKWTFSATARSKWVLTWHFGEVFHILHQAQSSQIFRYSSHLDAMEHAASEDACYNFHLPREIFDPFHPSSISEITASETKAFQFCGQHTRCEHGSFWGPIWLFAAQFNSYAVWTLYWYKWRPLYLVCKMYDTVHKLFLTGAFHVRCHNVLLQTNEYTYYYNTFLVKQTYCFQVIWFP
jgi:hypothetical protein